MLSRTLVASILFLGVSTFAFAKEDAKVGGKWIKHESPYSAINSPHESWRKEMFGEQATKRGCRVISRGLKFNKLKDPNLISFVKTIQNALAARDHKALVPLFHPRLKVKPLMVEKVLVSFMDTYGGKTFKVTPFRVWALNSPNGKAALTECQDDQLSLRSFYGYPLQMGILFQVTGTREIGHNYISAVPKKDKWYIGAWHKMQWTHAGKDPETWIDEALKDYGNKNTMAAFAKMDLAYKLLDGGAFVYYQLRKDAEATRNSYLKYENWKKYFDEKLPEERIVHAGTALVDDGVGVLLRYVVDHNLPSNKLREKCRDLGKILYKEPWTQTMGGIKCSMVTKYEDPGREGSLGGNYFPASALR